MHLFSRDNQRGAARLCQVLLVLFSFTATPLWAQEELELLGPQPPAIPPPEPIIIPSEAGYQAIDQSLLNDIKKEDDSYLLQLQLEQYQYPLPPEEAANILGNEDDFPEKPASKTPPPPLPISHDKTSVETSGGGLEKSPAPVLPRQNSLPPSAIAPPFSFAPKEKVDSSPPPPIPQAKDEPPLWPSAPALPEIEGLPASPRIDDSQSQGTLQLPAAPPLHFAPEEAIPSSTPPLYSLPTLDTAALTPPLPLEDLNPEESLGPDDLGQSSYFSPNSHFKKRIIFETVGGAGPYATQTSESSLSLRLGDHIIGVSYERAQWLDPTTNTGKFIQDVALNYCAAISFDLSWLSAQPCYNYGVGQGSYRERDALNNIVQHERNRDVFKIYGRLVFSIPAAGQHFNVEAVTGYSEDSFLYGPYSEAWVRLPVLGLSLGAQSYSGQRNSLLLGFGFGVLDVP